MHISEAAVEHGTVQGPVPPPASNGDGPALDTPMEGEDGVSRVALGTPRESETLLSSPGIADLERRVNRLEESVAHLLEAPRQEPAPLPRAREEATPAKPAAIGKPLAPPEPAPADTPAPRTWLPAALAAPLAMADRRFLALEMWTEVRAIIRMFFDPRYRLSWTARTVPACTLFLIATSQLWFFPVPWLSVISSLLGTLLDKTIDMALAYVLFKVLSNEARRYRRVSPDIPSSLRL